MRHFIQIIVRQMYCKEITKDKFFSCFNFLIKSVVSIVSFCVFILFLMSLALKGHDVAEKFAISGIRSSCMNFLYISLTLLYIIDIVNIENNFDELAKIGLLNIYSLFLLVIPICIIFFIEFNRLNDEFDSHYSEHYNPSYYGITSFEIFNITLISSVVTYIIGFRVFIHIFDSTFRVLTSNIEKVYLVSNSKYVHIEHKISGCVLENETLIIHNTYLYKKLTTPVNFSRKDVRFWTAATSLYFGIIWFYIFIILNIFYFEGNSGLTLAFTIINIVLSGCLLFICKIEKTIDSKTENTIAFKSLDYEQCKFKFFSKFIAVMIFFCVCFYQMHLYDNTCNISTVIVVGVHILTFYYYEVLPMPVDKVIVINENIPNVTNQQAHISLDPSAPSAPNVPIDSNKPISSTIVAVPVSSNTSHNYTHADVILVV